MNSSASTKRTARRTCGTCTMTSNMEWIRQSWLDLLAITQDWLRTEGKEFMTSIVGAALLIHLNETGHEVQFKEEWVYDLSVRCPWLADEARHKVILRGATRFENAHAVIEWPNGEREIQSLGPAVPKGISDEQLQCREWSVSIG